MTNSRNVISKDKNWCTPESYVRIITEFFGHIDLDPCWNHNSKVKATVCYNLPNNDGLAESWNFNRIYVNPPYGYDKGRGTHIRDWLCRCVEAYRNYNSEIIALVPVATNTKHWIKYVFGVAGAICFIHEPRVKFSGMPKGAPMACAFIYYGTNVEKFTKYFGKLGTVLKISDSNT